MPSPPIFTPRQQCRTRQLPAKKGTSVDVDNSLFVWVHIIQYDVHTAQHLSRHTAFIGPDREPVPHLKIKHRRTAHQVTSFKPLDTKVSRTFTYDLWVAHFSLLHGLRSSSQHGSGRSYVRAIRPQNATIGCFFDCLDRRLLQHRNICDATWAPTDLLSVYCMRIRVMTAYPFFPQCHGDPSNLTITIPCSPGR